MSLPLTWGGLTSVSLAAAVQSDWVALGEATVVAAQLYVTGSAPNGISGSFQLQGSNDKIGYVNVPGTFESVYAANGSTVTYGVSVSGIGYAYVRLAWVPGADQDGSATGLWNLTGTPLAPQVQTAAPQAVSTGGSTGQSFAAPASVPQLVALLRRVFPERWVTLAASGGPNGAPAGVYAAILKMVATALGASGDQLLPVNGATVAILKQQLRLKSMSGNMLDLAAQDFYGDTLPRLPGEGDTSYLQRVTSGLFIPRVTRSAVFTFLLNQTGIAPRIVELWRPSDCGCWYGSTVAGKGIPFAGWAHSSTSTSEEGAAASGNTAKLQATFRWSGPGSAAVPTSSYVGLVETAPPATGGAQGNAVQGVWGPDALGGGKYAAGGGWYGPHGGSPAWAYFNPQQVTGTAQAQAGQALTRQVDQLRPAGVLVGVKIRPAAALAAEGWTG